MEEAQARRNALSPGLRINLADGRAPRETPKSEMPRHCRLGPHRKLGIVAPGWLLLLVALCLARLALLADPISGTSPIGPMV